MSDLINKPFPSKDFKFQYIDISQDDSKQESCKMPQTVSWADFLKQNKTVVITGAPAAFSPTCSISHIPGYVSYESELVQDKHVDQVVVLTVDNPFANQAWAKSLGVTDTTHFKFASDAGCALIKTLGFEMEVGDNVFWSGRWAIIVKDGKITYAAKEEHPATEVTVTSVETILTKL
ncbi:hypothetical protein NCAS_0C03400 [Naumovozyma castellii]|uniref:Thioredoxin domain-containing protein n=1 Tax=Naumovozyma castellii TaxID=27288 RepID=G0VCW9_NAUCA|nr:hypothetical protein NCAS_0C03400 [Naumovozyma castellii CBS 4309]CCC69330.1 hypothetical protein NCAS_0C03400 [Naumovozyma castellii CBS 4309]